MSAPHVPMVLCAPTPPPLLSQQPPTHTSARARQDTLAATAMTMWTSARAAHARMAPSARSPPPTPRSPSTHTDAHAWQASPVAAWVRASGTWMNVRARRAKTVQPAWSRQPTRRCLRTRTAVCVRLALPMASASTTSSASTRTGVKCARALKTSL